MKVAPQKIVFKRLPRDDEELWWTIFGLWGYRIPRVAVCPGHTAPFTALAEAYFARTPAAIWKASRGLGGKSRSLGILSLTEAALLGSEVSILGGSFQQSVNVHEATKLAWSWYASPRHLLVQEPTRMSTQLTNGGKLNILTASTKSARGLHPPRLRLDEIDEMDQMVLDSALGQPMEQRGADGTMIVPQTVLSSTHHYPDKAMTEMISRAKSQGWPLREWCYKESSNPVDGWLTQEGIERARSVVSEHMWCVPDNSPVDTAEGVVRVIDLKVGDKVWTRQGWKPVTKKRQSAVQPVLQVCLDDGRVYEASGQHTVATPQGWKRTDLLKVGDPVLVSCPSHGLPMTSQIASITLQEPVRTWDIEVADAHEFTVNGIILHNSTEYDLQEPSFGGRAIDTAAVDRCFTPALGTFDGQDPVYLVTEENAHYITGVDWAKSRDQTIIATFDTTQIPWRCVGWQKVNRIPWPMLVRRAVDQYRRFGGMLAHDATGVGATAHDLLREQMSDAEFQKVKPIIMGGGRERDALYTEYISAIEHDDIRYPRITYAYDEHRYVKDEDLFTGKGHAPDSVVAGALAWSARRKRSVIAVGPDGGVRAGNTPWKV